MAKMKTLTSVEHILVRPNLWIGSVAPSEKETWVLNEDFIYRRSFKDL